MGLIIDWENNTSVNLKSNLEPWKIQLIDTGEESDTAERLSKVAGYIKEKTFCFTYGDGVADVDINALINFHNSSKKEATLTAVQPPGRFGALNLKNDLVTNFQEKADGINAWINGGFFVLNRKVLSRITKEHTSWDQMFFQ